MEDLITLVTQVRGGSHDAFATLVSRFQSLAFGMAYTALRDHHLAEDVAQNAFVTAYQHMSKLEDPAAFAGWFRTLLMRQVRKAQRKPLQPASLSLVSSAPSQCAQPTEAAAMIEDTQCVHLALSQLPEHLRITTVLFYFHDSKVGEIAQFLEVPQTTIKKRLVDARRKLKAMWKTVQSQLPRMKPQATQRFMESIRSRTVCTPGNQKMEVSNTPEEHEMKSAVTDKPDKSDQEASIADLWRQYKSAPTKELRNHLIEHYLPLVNRIAKREADRLPSHIEQDDLVTPGIFGLMDATESFDLTRGIKFETFAARRIHGAILDEVRSQDWVPRLVRNRCRQVGDVARRFAMRHGRPATDKDLEQATGLSTSEFRRIKNDALEIRISSMDQPRATNCEEGERDRLTIADTRQLNPLTAVERLCIKEVVLRGMTRAERLIVILYYYEQMTMKEIGATLDLSESRVSQMHSSILARLRARMTPQALEGVLAGA